MKYLFIYQLPDVGKWFRRVNREITKQHKLGRLKLYSLQPPGSLDGMEMFGFTSPFIVQRIQTMDRHRLCKEYWKSHPFHSQYIENNENSPVMIPGPNNPYVTKNNSLQTRVDTIMASLFEKASLEEFNILQSFMFKGDSISNRTEVARLLNEGIQKRPR